MSSSAFRSVWVGLVPLLTAPVIAAADWPQWRGADRSNISPDTKLLAKWPAEGPPQLWKAEGIGYGVPSIAVADGKVYALGYKDGKEHLTALNEKDGKSLWSVPVGPEVREMPSMRYLSQRTPTVDRDRVYVFTARGELICLQTVDGKEQWRKDYLKDFGGKPGAWGYCDFPLVDGGNLICTPGAANATVVALNKKTGELVWKCGVEKNTRGTYCGIVVAEIDGTRQYVHQIEAGVIGISAKDGKLLWQYAPFGTTSGNVHTAIVRGDEVFAMCGWGVGAALLRIKKNGDEFKVEEVFRNKLSLDPWIGSAVRLGEFVHTSGGVCAEWTTGKIVAQDKGLPTGRISMTAADSKLIYRNASGTVTLVEIGANGVYKRTGEFKISKVGGEPTWTCPVVANGHLYLRDQDTLLCFDLRVQTDAKEPKEKEKEKKEPDVIFIPTPQDVVEKMLDAAKVTKSDVVADLGCGDGRIVVTAAKKYGCKAIGYDLDPECVRLSRAAVKEAGVEKLADIEEVDLFRVDLAKLTVVTLFLGEKLNEKLIPQLNAMKPGSRVVSHVFVIPGVKPDTVLKITSAEDDVERPVYVYTVPLRVEKK
jgi:outer membrane protein assembly factor BamB/precorrin-6B methylase 2